MSPNGKPFSRDYFCPRVGRSVVVKGVTDSLFGGTGKAPLAIGNSVTNCTGMPHCGCRIAQSPCPYQSAAPGISR